MTATDALTTTAAQVEAILVDHSVTYTTTDNRGKEEDDYRVTVGDVTAYLTVSDDGDVWAITDENPADAYDGPAVADDIALHLMHYAAEIPAAVTVIDAAMNAAEGNVIISYWDEYYWTVEGGHATVEVSRDGTWTVTQCDVDGIEWSGYKGRDVAAVFRAGDLAYAMPRAAIARVIRGGDYEDADWWSIVDGLTELQAVDGDVSTRVFPQWSGHPGVLVTEVRDDEEPWWDLMDLEAMTTSMEHYAADVAAYVIHALA